MFNQKLYVLFGLVAPVLATGCQTFKAKPFEPITAVVQQDEEFSVKTPAKVVALWKEATLDDSDGTAVRGFAGRLYFFDQNEQPVKVDGQLVVYGFDDSNESQQRETPDKKFIIEREGLANKYSVSDVGPSYSVWLPWDEVGGFHKTIALLTMFKSIDGAIVRSEATKNSLPGKQQPHIAERESLLKEIRQSIRNVGRSTPAESANEQVPSSAKINTTTIQLSPNMRERLESSENQRNSSPTFPGVVIPAGIVPSAAFPGAVENNVIPAYRITDDSSLAKPIPTIGESVTKTSTQEDRPSTNLLR